MNHDAIIKGIIKKAKAYLPNLNEARVHQAYVLAAEAHAGQFRESGEPYIMHPLGVTEILLELKPDEDSIITSLLHDVLEDTDMPLETLTDAFGEQIVPLLKGLEKLGKVHYRGRERQIENLRKMFMAMAKDIRVILIKLADRLHNMRTLDSLKKEEKKVRVAMETLEIYSPIAARLGIYKIKNELDELGFRYAYQAEFNRIQAELKELTGQQKNIIKKASTKLVTALKAEGIDADISGRVKSSYSIHKKLHNKEKNYVSDLYDIFALRIIVPSEGDCYRTLGVIHKLWTPVPRRFKDYIAMAKANGYQSLHTTLIGLSDSGGHPMEVQIRTPDMNRVAEFGVAAHWTYKEGNTLDQEHKLDWIKNLVELHENLKNNAEFIETLNVDVFHDRIFVLTPKGDVYDLPKKATPVDFAYAIHTHVGHRCKGAKVNGKIVPLDYELRNGQIVEIITTNHDQPNRYWLSFAVTNHAVSRIKQWFNSQDHDKLLTMGKELLNKTLRQLGQAPLDQNYTLFKTYLGEKLSVKERENVIERVGNGSLQAVDVIKKALPANALMKRTVQEERVREVLSDSIHLETPDILITGERGYKTQLASCCEPTPEHTIIGYITRGRGVTIHKKGCRVLRGHESNRLIKANWSSEKVPHYDVMLKVERRSRIGLLRDVANLFANNELTITDMNNSAKDSYMMIGTSVDSIDTLTRLINQLEQVEGIFEVVEMG